MRRPIQYLVMTLVAGGLFLGVWLVSRPRKPPVVAPVRAPQDAAPTSTVAVELPPIKASRFANTSRRAHFIGGTKCAECHPAERASYLQTPHSRALGDVDFEKESTALDFQHPRSNRKYEVLTKGEQIWHRETLLADDGNDDGNHLVLAEYPLHLTIGSGNHSRSYLVEADGFLLESPVTWYASKQTWAMSPGYEAASSPGFERVADVGCIFCHAGRVEPVDGNRFKVKIHDQSIGCESCHGPGSLHAARRESKETIVDVEDVTIVNPSHLTRAESEAICAQCHLRGDASVALSGRVVQDFRPGLLLNDFRADYVLEQPDESMKVVGHVEQMRLSSCYQQSETLTCTTCHDPHDKPPAADRVSHFRNKCLTCHQVDACGLEQDERLARDQQDNCMACHMPQSPTDIPHFAFTHHRVGIHEKQSPEEALSQDVAQAQETNSQVTFSRLLPLHDLSHLPLLEQQRCLGLANLEVSDKQTSPEAHAAYRERAIRLLEAVSQTGLRDGDVEATLARIYWERNDLQRAILFAGESLKSPGTSGAATNALFVLGDSYLAADQPAKARPFLEELVKLRRQSEDWVLLGLCQRSTGQFDNAIFSLERAVEISPARPDARSILADLYESRGNQDAAAKHRQAAFLLRQQIKPNSPALPSPP